MKTNKLFLIAALLGTVLAACQKETEVQKPETGKAWTLKVQATKDVDTRALDYSGNSMAPYWKNGELVDVYLGGDKLGTLTVTSADHADPATLEGTVSVDALSEGDDLMLIYPGGEDAEWTYLGQTGALPEEYDYATASLTVESLDAATQTINTTTENAHFANQQSIYRFNFKVGGAGDAIPVKSFIVASDEEMLVRSRSFNDGWNSVFGTLFVNTAEATSPYLTSIRNDNTSADKYTFTAVGNNNALYVGEKALDNGVVNGKFYNANITVTQKAFTPGTGSVDSEDDVL